VAAVAIFIALQHCSTPQQEKKNKATSLRCSAAAKKNEGNFAALQRDSKKEKKATTAWLPSPSLLRYNVAS